MGWGKESRHARGYGYAWTKTRARVLRRDKGLCQACLTEGRVTAATEVHHVRAKADGGTDDEGNLTSICRPCHEAATLKARGYRAPRQIGPDGYPL